jgi:hypothetical protein
LPLLNITAADSDMEVDTDASATASSSSRRSSIKPLIPGAYFRDKSCPLSQHPLTLDPTRYKLKSYELPEDSDLEIIGETDPAEASDRDDDELPIRELHNFTLYHSDTLALIPATDLLAFGLNKTEDNRFGASGIAKPHMEVNEFDDDELDDSSEGESQFVKLTNILELNVHYYSDGELDGCALRALF